MLDSVINPIHLMIILAVVVVLFGPKRLPEMGQKIGQALRDFKSATSDIRSQIGVDDIADSVNEIRSSFSLTSDSPRAASTVGGDAPAPAESATATETVDTSVTAADEPTAVRLGDELSETDPVAAAAPTVDQPTVGSDGFAAPASDEGGVEAFGSLTRSSVSSRAGMASD
jgi:sec-independent protein translocase protein TatA